MCVLISEPELHGVTRGVYDRVSRMSKASRRAFGSSSTYLDALKAWSACTGENTPSLYTHSNTQTTSRHTFAITLRGSSQVRRAHSTAVCVCVCVTHAFGDIWTRNTFAQGWRYLFAPQSCIRLIACSFGPVPCGSQGRLIRDAMRSQSHHWRSQPCQSCRPSPRDLTPPLAAFQLSMLRTTSRRQKHLAGLHQAQADLSMRWSNSGQKQASNAPGL